MQQPRADVEGAVPQPGATVPCAPGAFEEAYLEFGPRLRKIAIHKFGVPAVDAETIVQDVFITFLTQMPSVRAVEPYLIGAICNASRHYWRRTGAAKALFCGEIPCAASPDEPLAETIERKLMLSRILKRVDCRCRDLLHRYYIDGETFDTIAAALEVKATSVPVLMHQCRRRALAAYRSLTEGR
jgi:RNA polymerase sigma factor (sigma-70 family)